MVKRIRLYADSYAEAMDKAEEKHCGTAIRCYRDPEYTASLDRWVIHLKIDCKD